MSFDERLPNDEGWNKENIHFWRRDYRAYLEHFFTEAFPEPHSTKQIDDGVGWGLDTDPETLGATLRTPLTVDAATFAAMCATIRTPALVIQGTDDRSRTNRRARASRRRSPERGSNASRAAVTSSMRDTRSESTC